jgi:4-azaleucine resistance transporter AzlC
LSNSPRLAEFRSGALAIAPLAAAATPFGLIMGAEAVRHGLDPAEAALMSASVFAGGAQFLAVGLWQRPAPWETLTLAVLLVNLRHVLLSASIVRKMGLFRPWQRYLAAFFLTDEGWATSERRAAERPLTPAFYAGVGLTMYGVWLAATIVGTIAGGLIPRPEIFGLDFAFPAVFIGMVVSFAKSWRAVPIIAASAIAAFIAHRALHGAWYVIIGALAGMAVAFAERPRADDGTAS